MSHFAKTSQSITPTTLADAAAAFSWAIHSDRLFQDAYNLATKQGLAHNTDAIQRGVAYVKDFIAYLNEMTGDH